MYLPRTLLLALLAYSPALALSPAKRAYDTHNYYVLEHNPFGASLVDIAQALGVEIVEQAGELRHHWLVRAEKPLEGVVARGELSDRVLETFESLRGLSSRPPDVSRRSEDTRDLASSITSISRQIPRQRVKRAPPPIRPPLESSSSGVAARLGIQDPLFSKQWHLVNDEYPEHMMNATPVWEMGLTGKGVISSLVDDGLDYTSEDLKDNFVCFHVIVPNGNSWLIEFRMRTTPTTLTTTRTCPHQNYTTTIMAPAAQAKLLRAKTPPAASVLRMNPRLQGFVSSQDPSPMLTRPLP